MLGRCHLVRVLLGALFVLIVVGIIYRRTLEKEAVISLPLKSLRSLSMTAQEVDALTRANETCPVCFGKDACEELMTQVVSGMLQIDKHPFNHPDSSSSLVMLHRVYRNGKERFLLKSGPSDSGLMTSLEEAICRRTSRNRICNLQTASMALKTVTLDVKAIRTLYRFHLVSGSRIPLTVCPSYKLLEGLIKSHDENGDNVLTADEKSQLVTTLAANPELAVYRFVMSGHLSFPLLPFFGACGRLAFIQGPLHPLNSYVENQPLPVRIELAADVLQMVEGFINDDPEWLLFTTHLTIDNFVVQDSGQVYLRDLSKVMILHKADQEDGEDDAAKSSKPAFVCDSKCFSDFYDQMVQDKSDEIPTSCRQVSRYAGHMFSLICQNVLQDHDKRQGLLHSLGEGKGDKKDLGIDDISHVKTLLSKCSRASDLNAREAAAMKLLDLLTEDEDAEEDVEKDDDGSDDEQEEVNAIGDEDLGEDQYAKAHDEKKPVEVSKEDKYDFDDGANLDKNPRKMDNVLFP